nr:hypothetical protein BaRGS_008152 [Batillaria attramentaria]
MSWLKINISKTEVMRVNHKQHDPIQLLHQEDIKEVDKFVYLGSVVSKDGGTDEDIKSRTNKARHAFRTLRPIWRSTALSLRNKIRIFNSNVKSLDTFQTKCLRRIRRIFWPNTISNEELLSKADLLPLIAEKKYVDMAEENSTQVDAARETKTRQAKRDLQTYH